MCDTMTLAPSLLAASCWLARRWTPSRQNQRRPSMCTGHVAASACLDLKAFFQSSTQIGVGRQAGGNVVDASNTRIFQAVSECLDVSSRMSSRRMLAGGREGGHMCASTWRGYGDHAAASAWLERLLLSGPHFFLHCLGTLVLGGGLTVTGCCRTPAAVRGSVGWLLQLQSASARCMNGNDLQSALLAGCC